MSTVTYFLQYGLPQMPAKETRSDIATPHEFIDTYVHPKAEVLDTTEAATWLEARERVEYTPAGGARFNTTVWTPLA